MGSEKTLNALYNHLRQFHLSESLYLIGSINATLKYGFKGLYKDDIPKHILLWLGRIPDDHQMRLNLFLSSTRLARFLILSGANDYRNKALKLEDDSYSKAIDMAGDLYDEELEEKLKKASKSLANNILGRMSHWQFPLQEDRRISLGRANLLFNTIPRSLTLSYNFDNKMEEYFGMNCFEFFATGFALWLKSNGTLDYQLKIEIKTLEGVITESTQIAFLKLSSGTPESYRRKIRGDNWKVINKLYDIYFIDPFMQMPAVAVQHSLKFRKDTYVVPQAKYLLDRASTGVFYLLADKEQELSKLQEKSGSNPFRVCFGEVYRAYVGRQLKQCENRLVLIDLDDDYVHNQDGKIPDFALIDGSICILFEVKTSLLTASSRAFFDEKRLKEEISRGSFNKALKQLDEFKTHILNSKLSDERFNKVDTVINIIVGYEDIFVLNSYLLPLLKDAYGAKSENLQLASITDIDAIGCLLENKSPIGKIFKEKIHNKDMETWPFMQYLKADVRIGNKILQKSFENFMDSMGNIGSEDEYVKDL